jgi:hypothetical protein
MPNPKLQRKQPKTPAAAKPAAEPDYAHEAQVAWLKQVDDMGSVHFWLGLIEVRLRGGDVPAELRAELQAMLARAKATANVKRGIVR